jgi:N-acyl-L-homoserine lactone synthetase
MDMFLTGTSAQLGDDLADRLARYRHFVFVEQLGWNLGISEPGIELDEFDRDDTLYLLARDGEDRICGCARLLPTTRSYLLAKVFPQLLGNQAAPHSGAVWELSRFSVHPPAGVALGRAETNARFLALLRAVVRAAAERRVERLITFSGLGLERIARMLGLHTHRAGPAQAIDGKPALAYWIELDAQTFRAVGLQVGNCLPESSSRLPAVERRGSIRRKATRRAVTRRA